MDKPFFAQLRFGEGKWIKLRRRITTAPEKSPFRHKSNDGSGENLASVTLEPRSFSRGSYYFATGALAVRTGFLRSLVRVPPA